MTPLALGQRSRAARFAALLAGASTSGAACGRRAPQRASIDARSLVDREDGHDARPSDASDQAPPEPVTPLELAEAPERELFDARGRPRARAHGFMSRPCPAREPREGARCEAPMRCSYGVRALFECGSVAGARWRRAPVTLARGSRDACPAESPVDGDRCDRVAVCSYVSGPWPIASVVCTRGRDDEPWRWRWGWSPAALRCAGTGDSAPEGEGSGWRCDATEQGFRWRMHGVPLIEGPLPPPSLRA